MVSATAPAKYRLARPRRLWPLVSEAPRREARYGLAPMAVRTLVSENRAAISSVGSTYRTWAPQASAAYRARDTAAAEIPHWALLRTSTVGRSLSPNAW